jgi:hypothetical protein
MKRNKVRVAPIFMVAPILLLAGSATGQDDIRPWKFSIARSPNKSYCRIMYSEKDLNDILQKQGVSLPPNKSLNINWKGANVALLVVTNGQNQPRAIIGSHFKEGKWIGWVLAEETNIGKPELYVLEVPQQRFQSVTNGECDYEPLSIADLDSNYHHCLSSGASNCEDYNSERHPLKPR